MVVPGKDDYVKIWVGHKIILLECDSEHVATDVKFHRWRIIEKQFTCPRFHLLCRKRV